MSDLFGLLRVFLEIDNSHEQALDRIDRLALTEEAGAYVGKAALLCDCLLYTSPSPRDRQKSRMPSSA